MSILKSVLTGLLESDSFVKGSKELLDTVFKSIERHFEVAKPHIVADWKNWIENIAPKSDDAGEYCATHPLEIPLLYELFGIGTAGDAHHHNVTATSIPSREIRYRSTPGIVHRNSTSVVSAPLEAYDVSTGQALEEGIINYIYV